MEKETLHHFFEGEASSKEKETIYEWEKTGSEHERELLEERRLFDLLTLSAPPRFIAERESRRVRSKKIFLEILKVAAIFILVLSGSVYFYKQEIKKYTQTGNTITVPAGQRANIVLPDGTNVWLNAHTTICYPAVFSGNKREITLDGEAYFEVTHLADKPFIVQTKRCAIEVLGTKFNVDAYGYSDDFCTSLLEGSVKISDRKDRSQTVVLTPNLKASFENGRLTTSAITDFDLFRWKEGLICFRNTSFEQLMLRFEKCYDIQIVIQNKRLLNYVCSGKFRISDGIDNALRILQKDAKYTFERNQEESVIYIK